jgi:hypothetical protein
MRRREFIAGLGSAATWPVVARGQQPNKYQRKEYCGTQEALMRRPFISARSNRAERFRVY